MGEYADMAINDGATGWRGRTDVGYGLSPIALKTPKTCKSCGRGWLFWSQTDNRWRLHHWSMLPTDRRPRFILHRCGLTSEGKPIAAALTGETGGAL